MHQPNELAGCHTTLKDSEVGFRDAHAAAPQALAHHGKMAEVLGGIETRMVPLALLEAWLRAPGTTRRVRRCEYVGGRWEIEISAGGFLFESKTQESLEGAIRNVLQAATP